VGLSWTAPGGSPPATYHVYDGTSPGLSLHEIGLAETYVVRLEPLPAAIITTIEELERTS
jgi:hypothetical protein